EGKGAAPAMDIYAFGRLLQDCVAASGDGAGGAIEALAIEMSKRRAEDRPTLDEVKEELERIRDSITRVDAAPRFKKAAATELDEPTQRVRLSKAAALETNTPSEDLLGAPTVQESGSSTPPGALVAPRIPARAPIEMPSVVSSTEVDLSPPAAMLELLIPEKP